MFDLLSKGQRLQVLPLNVCLQVCSLPPYWEGRFNQETDILANKFKEMMTLVGATEVKEQRGVVLR